jgi:hypothetical protein
MNKFGTGSAVVEMKPFLYASFKSKRRPIETMHFSSVTPSGQSLVEMDPFFMELIKVRQLWEGSN